MAMLAACLGAPLVHAQAGAQSPAPVVADAASALQNAVASVVVVALTEQFDGKSISVSIDSQDVQVTGARERSVTGQGRVRVAGAGDDQWIAFRFRTLYDVVADHAAYPTISIGSVGGAAERSVPNDSTLIGQLDERVVAALSKELGGKRVWLQLDDIESYESGARFVRIDASGVADFGIDGTTPARVEALYDREKDAWLRVNYQLGATAAGTSRLPIGG